MTMLDSFAIKVHKNLLLATKLKREREREREMTKIEKDIRSIIQCTKSIRQREKSGRLTTEREKATERNMKR